MSERPTVIAGNWKMHTTVDEAVELVGEMSSALAEFENVEVIICPPFIALCKVKELLGQANRIQLGAQNMYQEAKGAFTGEISPVMLQDFCKYVIIGHSERREIFQETDDMIKLKVRAALKFGLKPILCVGENLAQREGGKVQEVIEGQITKALDGVNSPDIYVAYEPVWAIGTGRAATGDIANETAMLIRNIVGKLYGNAVSQALPVLYGGSVNPENISDFISRSDIDGALVGGASIKAGQFVEIVRKSVQS
ncbi:triosephosphate isomerase [Dehalogenimonas lykanthroporepellens BL-DC-9]|jgi:triosephosphate isomerase|nr:triosephosphate isomerase [Dehalogenimonas lykanthroporepellens BL-DC-9]